MSYRTPLGTGSSSLISNDPKILHKSAELGKLDPRQAGPWNVWPQGCSVGPWIQISRADDHMSSRGCHYGPFFGN